MVVSVFVSFSVWWSALRFLVNYLACCLPVATWWESSNVAMICGVECGKISVEVKRSVSRAELLYMLPACVQSLSQDTAAAHMLALS